MNYHCHELITRTLQLFYSSFQTVYIAA